MTFTVRYAESDQDVVALHGFLCVVAGPLLPGNIDPKKSSTEVWRVVNHECALMAISDEGFLVGTIGLVKCEYWWGNECFLANRWFFSLPDVPAGKPLLEEAEKFARGLTPAREDGYSGLELHIYDEQKGRLVILNKDPKRQSVNPIFVKPPVNPTHEAAALLQ